MPASSAAVIIISLKMRLVSRASEPPFKSTPLPLFRHKAAICTRASGRDSKITPITPMGQVTLYNSRPTSSSVARSVLPTGSSSSIKSLMPFITVSIFSSSKTSLFSRGGARFSSLLRARSSLFAAIIFSLCRSKAPAICLKAPFFTLASAAASRMAACFTREATFFMSITIPS